MQIDLDANETTTGKIPVEIPLGLTSTKMLSSECRFTILYPKQVLDYDTSKTTIGYSVDTTDDASGVLNMLITTTTYGTYSLAFKTKLNATEMKQFKNTSYSLAFDELEIADLSGYPCDLSIDYGKISIVKSNVDVLGYSDNNTRAPVEGERYASKAIPGNPLNQLILVG